MHRKIICLVGFMGSGKTTIGRLLARQIGWRFADLDTLIEQRAAQSIPQIFERHGEAAFREMEHDALQRTVGEATASGHPTVIALGGGTFAQPYNFELLRVTAIPVIWIECSLENLLSRCATKTNRPLFRDEFSFRQLYESRLPFYQQAGYRVDGDASPAEVVERTLALGLVSIPEREACGE